MNRFLLSFLFVFALFFEIAAQLGGQSTFQVLNLSPSARVTALGSNLITVADEDVVLAYGNPAVLNEAMNNALAFNHQFHVGGIQNGYFGFGKHLEKWEATMHAGVSYVTYGELESKDEFERSLGSFKAAEYVVTAGLGKALYERLSVGLNLKFISSQLEGYEAVGIAADVAAFYHVKESDFSASLVFRNAGTQLSRFGPGDNEPLPFEIQFGISKRLQHLPFRFSIIATNLQRGNILYDDPDAEEEPSLLGDIAQQGEDPFGDWVDNLFRHLIFNGEFLFGAEDNFRLRFAYNHLQHQELSVEGLRGVEGFSFGVGFKIGKFHLDYGHNFFHRAGDLNHIGISTNLGYFKR